MDNHQPADEGKPPGESTGGLSVGLENYFAKFGPLMMGRDLWRALGYPTFAAFVMARRRGTVPVAVFEIPMRKGVFAYTEDVARWVTQLRLQVVAENPKEDEPDVT